MENFITSRSTFKVLHIQWTSGERELNGPAEKDRVNKSKQTKSMQKRSKKHQAQAVKMHATGNSTVLTNELNANLAIWEKYVAG